MSKQVSDHTSRHLTADDGRQFASAQPNVDIRGPPGSVESHEDNDHFALIYEDRRQQFETVVPFIEEGLERGERCIYVADDNTVDEVLEAMRIRGIPVERARESGALVVHTAEETYRRTGEFDREAMLEFWEGALADATADEFTGLRAAAEMTWALDDDETELDDLCEYEELLNPLYDGEDYAVLCQYNRNRFPAEILHDVLKTHPFLVYDDTTVCQNFYYTPPAEYFGDARPSRELDRKLATLVDRTDARTTIETRERYQRELYETIADPTASLGEKIENLLELGRQRLGLEIGYFTETRDENAFEIVEAVGDHEQIRPGVTDSLCDTYCEKLLASPGTIAVRDAAEVGWTDDPAYERFGLDAYFGTTVHVGGEEYGTLCFAAETPRERSYTDAERTFLDLMGQCVEYELERRRRERFLRESYRITADTTRNFDEKLEELLELGREWFGLEMGGLNHLPAWGGEFRLERGVGLGVDPDEELWSNPGYGCFCRQTIEADEPIAMADVRGTNWEDDVIHREFGLTSYLGTRVMNGSTPYGTFWFGSTEPRDRPFSETERTFIELMGQWVSYELEREQREHHQQTLSRIAADPDRSFEAKLDDLFELGCERFDLEMGGIAKIDPATDSFTVQATNGDHDQLQPGAEAPLSETYCRATVDDEPIANVTDPERAGFGNTLAYDEFGVETYIGTRIELENEPDRTFFFVSTESRDRAFTDAELTFHQLMAQWIQYELERTQRERALEESNERLEQFAYAASHDLQEPLRMVTSYLQLLENRYADAFDEDGEEFLEFAVDGAERMREMIDGLLAYSRVETQGDPFEPVDLDSLLDAVREDLQIQIDETDAEITADDLPRVSGDASQLRQVFQNLLENAIRYSGDDPPRIRTDATRRGREWVISVEDDGIGIDPDDQDRVFTVFDRLHSREEYEGTGIGLALCQRIVERHGGDIWVDSEPGEGSTFSFTLPAVRDR
ncbi:MEDS domain-containing protein [Halopiger xanaduensis]|uniref:histidine kinase n=1 Tax=Halopiger xanaduensis (strain DSM 18323 / JCM 14033 / SH-6) TaxID=797210 RepID=F8D994_HALXS|nr:MEDS domain-containing protein [Halopiger xanaduensis]AEH36830.1 GAF sensor signal transduction histidine kinase [Halopiger xanaduensis SH-6]